jgi:hypothetical protein
MGARRTLHLRFNDLADPQPIHRLCLGVRIQTAHHRTAYETRLTTGGTRAAFDHGLFGGVAGGQEARAGQILFCAPWRSLMPRSV